MQKNLRHTGDLVFCLVNSLRHLGAEEDELEKFFCIKKTYQARDITVKYHMRMVHTVQLPR
jgi:hypothetical protein